MSSTSIMNSADGQELGREEAVATSLRFPRAGVTEARVLRRTPRRWFIFRCMNAAVWDRQHLFAFNN